MNLINDVLLLPARSRWYLDTWQSLSRRERRRLRRHPALRARQQAWEAAFMERLNAALKRVYGGTVRDRIPPDWPPLRMTFSPQAFTFPTSK